MDEPEESMHPAWQNRLIPVLRRLAKEYDCQVILATHSPQIISSATKDELRLLVRDENDRIKAVKCDSGAYGWTVERVLLEIQGVTHLRTPEVDKKLEELQNKINQNEYNTDIFKKEFKEMEEILGYSDKDLVLMRLEIVRKEKANEKNK